MINAHELDIGREFARHAFNGTSFVPDVRGDNLIADYLRHMQEVSQEFQQWVTDENQCEMT